nr:tyrosine-type recombinase/integrase [Eubacterium sp.]
IKEPKTFSSNRIVELPEFVIKLLLKKSKPVNLTILQITEKWKYCMKALHMSYTFHSLRHYSASIMHAQNIPTQYIMERGGWKTEHTLNRIYRNSLDDYARKFSKQTNNYFKDNFL